VDAVISTEVKNVEIRYISVLLGIDPGFSRPPQSKIIMYTNIWCTAIE
jgi:hypothetical protein